jgi:glycosyltransferase involved in cell wall biosynthesis
VMPLVSVVIPTHNRYSLLKEALDSVYAQKEARKMFELEVIVVDDASSDSTPDVVLNYPEARYLRLPTRKGPGVARNAGMAATKGPYIAFLDDDDVWLPVKLSLQVPVLERNPEVCAVCSEVQEQGRKSVLPGVHPAPLARVFHRLLLGNFYGNPAGFLLRRWALEAVGGFDESLSLAEDYDLWLRLAARFPFAFVPGVVALFRPSPHGLYATGAVDGNVIKTRRLIIENALTLLPDDAASRCMKRQARLACGINLISHYPIYRPEMIRSFVLTAFHEFPLVASSASGRGAIARRVREVVLASPDALDTARSFCEELRGAVTNRGLRHRVEVRRMLARVWAELAIGSFKSARLRRGAAWHALIISMVLDPSQILQKLRLSAMENSGWSRRLRRILTSLRGRGGTGPSPAVTRDSSD